MTGSLSTRRLQAAARAEFPDAFEGLDEPGRRRLLKAMGATLGLAGIAGCTSDQPDEQALPYVHQPEFMVPSQARHYATAVVPIGGIAQPVLGETHEGRPTKLEGLPDHPVTLGGADAFTQAAILGLYDPERSKGPRHAGQPCSWGEFDAALVANARTLDARKGDGLRILTGSVTSPTFERQMAELGRRWPAARWHVLEPIGDALRQPAARLAFGRPLDLLPRLDRAEVVVSFDDDLLGPGPHQTRNGRQWSARRRAFQGGEGGSRLFVAEPTPSLTGVAAEVRLAVSHGRLGDLCAALASRLGQGRSTARLSPREAKWIDAAAAALAEAQGRALVTAGAWQPPQVQIAAWRLTQALGGFGTTLEAIPPVVLASPDGEASFATLAADMAAGRVDTLLILDANPLYAAPPDLGFAASLRTVRLVVHAGLHVDETARRAHWHAPLEHDLETWSDARAVDGTVSLIQPLVRPFYAVRSRHAVVEAVQGRRAEEGRELVAATWRDAWGDDFPSRWPQSLRRGYIEGSAPPPAAPPQMSPPTDAASRPSDGVELIFRPDTSVWDGRFANNGALQELPRPLSKITWGSAFSISPALARRLGVENGDLVSVQAGRRRIEGPVWITPGQAPETVTAALGYGRRLRDQLGHGIGHDVYPLRMSDTPWALANVTVTKTGGHVRLAVTQLVQRQESHEMLRDMPLEAARAPAAPARKSLSFYPDRPQQAPQYGMSIDTDVCIGCNACITACDMENNIAIVGADLVAEGRQMHWLRIDHYADGDPEAPQEGFQPIPCMHCENAPCEVGCPVNATVHGPDGLNLQVYNRCIGTRTCSSYCPYKVRRFNWFDFTGADPPERRAQRNPNVSVRPRGVMEKCTYCIQRVSDARIAAKLDGRAVRDGEVRTACQQTCPTEAIVFGDVSDPQSAVSKRKASARDYALLPDENTRPRTTYLARIRPERNKG